LFFLYLRPSHFISEAIDLNKEIADQVGNDAGININSFSNPS